MLRPHPTRHIVHADLDAFYASVEQMDNPELKGKPVLVGGLPEDRGVVAACSYEAREFGVHSAMPMRTAIRLCPSAIIVRPRFGRYREASALVMDIFRSITPILEPMSLDEAYLDVTELIESGAQLSGVARYIKARVRTEVGLTVSVGAGASKSVAKIASDMGKPDGLVVIEPGTERESLSPLPVRKLAGIGPKTEQVLLRNGVETLGDLASMSNEWLKKLLGKRGPELGSLCRGVDNHPVTVERTAKSISAEETFSEDIGDRKRLLEETGKICERVARRLEHAGVQGKTVTLKLRLADFTTFTRSKTLAAPVEKPETIIEVSRQLLEHELQPGRLFRLIGVGVSNFLQEDRLPLFDIREESSASASITHEKKS